MSASALALTLTLIGGPTLLIEVNGVRLLTDPTFDPAGTRYEQGPVQFTIVYPRAVQYPGS